MLLAGLGEPLLTQALKCPNAHGGRILSYIGIYSVHMLYVLWVSGVVLFHDNGVYSLHSLRVRVAYIQGTAHALLIL